MSVAAVKKDKSVQKSVYFEPEVWKALDEHMKRERINNVSIAVNDAVKYALFPEHRDDRNADSAKLSQQILYSLNEHRKKTGADFAKLIEMLALLAKTYFMHTHQIPASEKAAAEAQATLRMDAFVEQVVRTLSKGKPMAENKS